MKKTPQPVDKSKIWQQRFNVASGDQEKLFKRFAEYYDAFNANQDTKLAPWRSKPYMPIIAQQVWALVAKFSAMRPGFEAKVRDQDMSEDDLESKAQAISKKLEFDYDSPYMDESMREKLSAVLLDTAVTGTGIAEVVWKTKTITIRQRIVDDNGYADLTKEKVIERVVGYNDFEPVNIFNVFVSPSTDRLNKGWLIIRDFVPVSDLKKTNEAKGGKFYQNLDKISGVPEYGNFQTHNIARNRLSLNTDKPDDTVQMATVYKCYEGDKICYYAVSKDSKDEGSWVLLRETTNYYWHGKWPLVKFHVKKRPFSFWGQGLAELAYKLQIIYNDVFAHYLDAWNLTNNPSFWIPENAEVDDYVVEPGSVIPYRGTQPPSPIQFAEPNANALEMIIGFLNQSIEGVTASQYATGMPNSATDKTQGTATGIMRLQDAAGDIVNYMRENVVNGIVQVGKMWHSNNQQFMQAPTVVTTNEAGKRVTKTVSPEMLQAEADIYIDSASMLPKSDDEKRDAALMRNKMLLELQQSSMAQSQMTAGATEPLYVNFQEMAESSNEALGFTNSETILMTEEQIQAQAVEKQKKAAMGEQLASMGYSPNPDEATQQMAEELMQSGMMEEDSGTGTETQAIA